MDLLQRFAAGDLDAFESLFRQHQSAVYRWIVRIVRDPATAEDLTVETFWRAHRAHARFRPDGNFEAWLRRIGTNAALDHLRAAHAHVPLPEDLPADAAPDAAEQSESRKAIRFALVSLPPRLRIVVQLRLIEEEPYRAIGEALGISESAVKLRMFRAVRILRKKLQQWSVRP
ncbi:MAG TPA: RNA polymerase sigma factor [Candidatus Dormibacteraeota bacterium]|jgi:RNA polymerase sigma-70 factor (ECF subfamily)|nr:RNA polymerase sigma factor [Candidatus Dormibacteraeota bacterium]